MNSPIKDLTDYLVLNADSNQPLTMGDNLFGFKLPEKSGTLACLIDTGGYEAEPSNIYNPTVQIITRAEIGNYLQAYSLMWSITEILHEVSNIEINGTNYILIWKLTEILTIGEDEKGRPILSCNLRIKRS